MAMFNFEILSPAGASFKGQSSSATFPTTSGFITVLPGHANLVTLLKKGVIVFQTSDGEKKVSITGGFLEISDYKVNVVTEFAMPSDEANKQKIEEAMRVANELKQNRKTSVDISVMEAHLKTRIEMLKSGGMKFKGKK
ncbi:MAG: ATP synthase F1 subunit epsilon [Elusimicrobiota bacterium]|jgi:F-type H+-transporting ATPase subunit epsilon|nr:ATP synthase F1 subunit epsilon [Elusimicrobiota bacterium]